MPENFYNEKAARGLIGRFKIVVGGMAAASLRPYPALAPDLDLAPVGLSTGQDRAGQDATATGLNAVENLTLWYGAGRAGTAPSAFRDRPVRPFRHLSARDPGRPGNQRKVSAPPAPATLPPRRSATQAGGPALGHDRVGDRRRGVSSPRINSARWRRRRVLAGPAVASSTSIFSSIRGSATARGRSGLSRYGELFILVPTVGFRGHCQRAALAPGARNAL